MFRDVVHKIQKWNERYAILRFFTSFFPMACCYGIFLFAYEIKFVREFIPVIHPVLMVWASFVAAYSLLVRQDWRMIKGWYFLAAFVAFAFITTLLNLKLGFVKNVTSFIFTVLPVFAFLPAFVAETKLQKKKRIAGILLGPAILVCIASIIALVLYLIRFNRVVEFGGIKELLGLRLYDPTKEDSGVILYGIYQDTNHAAIYALCFALYSVFLFFECKKGLYKYKWQNLTGMIFAVANFIVQIFYFPLANSRGGWAALIVLLVVTSFLYVAFGCSTPPKQRTEEVEEEGCVKYSKELDKEIKRHYTALNWWKSVGITLLVVIVSVGFLMGSRSVWAKVSYEFSTIGSTVNNGSINGEGGDYGEEDKEIDSFNKPSTAMGAGRLLIWKDGLKLYLKKPVFGENVCNNAYYGMKYYPNSELARGKALHNSYLDLLLDYGATGLISLMGFFIVCVVQIIKRIVAGKEKDIANYLIIGIAIAVACGSFFLSCIFINTTAMYFMLLVAVGYLIEPKEDEKKRK